MRILLEKSFAWAVLIKRSQERTWFVAIGPGDGQEGIFYSRADAKKFSNFLRSSFTVSVQRVEIRLARPRPGKRKP